MDSINSRLKCLGLPEDVREAIMTLIVRHIDSAHALDPMEQIDNTRALDPMEYETPSYSMGEAARYLYQLALQRNERLGAPVVQEGAWHMLLDLFASSEEGRSVSVSSLCLASGTPQTTALRHIQNMVAWGIIVRSRDSSDGRRTFLTLSDHARAHMHNAVHDITAPRRLVRPG